jgi:IclR family pca regulon transcriptional regulator
MPEDAQERYLESEAVPATEYAVTDFARLRRILRQVSQSGYAYVDQEAESGFRSVAVPVCRFDGKVVAALHLGSRTERVSEEMLIGSGLTSLRRCASDLARQLM